MKVIRSFHGRLQFQPYEDGLLTPYLYGLSSFGINKIEEVAKTIDEEVVPETSNPKVYEIRVNRSFIRTAVAVAAAIIIFFFMSTPVENTYVEKGNYAQLIPSELLEPFDNSMLLLTFVALKSIAISLLFKLLWRKDKNYTR